VILRPPPSLFLFSISSFADMSASPTQSTAPKHLSKEDIHTYAKAMMAAMETPDFQARVRAAMGRVPTPANAEAVMDRYEEVQADYFTNHYKVDSPNSFATTTSTPAATTNELEDLNDKLKAMDLREGSDDATPAPKLDGNFIMTQLRNAVSVYKDIETERIITQLCLLVESKVTALPATVPALKHLYVESVHGLGAADATAAARASGENPMPIVNPSPQMLSMMEMAMKTLTPAQRATLERAQQTMMNGSPPSPEDMREMFLIQRQLGAFMQTMQQFGQLPGGRGGRGGRGGGRGVARGKRGK
jgi:hypothetical protein